MSVSHPGRKKLLCTEAQRAGEGWHQWPAMGSITPGPRSHVYCPSLPWGSNLGIRRKAALPLSSEEHTSTFPRGTFSHHLVYILVFTLILRRSHSRSLKPLLRADQVEDTSKKKVQLWEGFGYLKMRGHGTSNWAECGIKEAELFRSNNNIVTWAFVKHLFWPSTTALCRLTFPHNLGGGNCC